MKNTGIKNTILTLLISGFLLGALYTISLAAAPNNTNTKTTPKTTQNFQGRNRQQFNIKPSLDKLVKAKTITTAQETKIIAFENKKNATRIAEMKKLRNMSAADRKTFSAKQFKPNQNKRVSQFADLVKNKTITQKQADAIDKVINAARPSGGNNRNN